MNFKSPKAYLTLAIILFFVEAWIYNKAEAYTNKQLSSLQLARSVGELYDLGKTLPAVVLQESSGCLRKLGDDGQSLGCAHVTVPAALDVLKYCSKEHNECTLLDYKYKDNQQLRVDLATNDSLNVVIAALYLKMKWDYFKRKGYSYSGSWIRAVVAYNTGQYKASRMTTQDLISHPYYTRIVYRMRQIKKFKKSNNVWI